MPKRSVLVSYALLSEEFSSLSDAQVCLQTHLAISDQWTTVENSVDFDGAIVFQQVSRSYSTAIFARHFSWLNLEQRKLRTQSAGLLILVLLKERIFIIATGSGSHCIPRDQLQMDFRIKVAINLSDVNELRFRQSRRSGRKRRQSSATRQRPGPSTELIPIRTTENTYQAGFVIAIEDTEFYIEGSSSLRFACPESVVDLEEIVTLFEEAYAKDLNEEHVARLRVGKHVISPTEQKGLFKKLYDAVELGIYVGEDLDIPFEISLPVSQSTGAHCMSLEYRATPTADSIAIDLSHPKYLGLLIENHITDFNDFNSCKLLATFYDGGEEQVSLKTCFSFLHVPADGWTMALDSGEWVMLPVLLLDQYVQSLRPCNTYALPYDWPRAMSEDDFVAELSNDTDLDSLNMHEDFTAVEGVNVEICDVIMNDRELLFLKSGSDGSLSISWISYLCQQAVQVADYLVSGNESVINKLNSNVDQPYVRMQNEQEFTFVLVLGYDGGAKALNNLSPNVLDALVRAHEDITNHGFEMQIVLTRKY